jgi:hypothetical protein
MGRAEMLEWLVKHDCIDKSRALLILSTVDEFGTSDPCIDLQSLIAGNRAGSDESALSVEEILGEYRNA